MHIVTAEALSDKHNYNTGEAQGIVLGALLRYMRDRDTVTINGTLYMRDAVADSTPTEPAHPFWIQGVSLSDRTITLGTGQVFEIGAARRDG